MLFLDEFDFFSDSSSSDDTAGTGLPDWLSGEEDVEDFDFDDSPPDELEMLREQVTTPTEVYDDDFGDDENSGESSGGNMIADFFSGLTPAQQSILAILVLFNVLAFIAIFLVAFLF